MTGALLADRGAFDVSLNEARVHRQRWTGASTPTGIDGFLEDAEQEAFGKCIDLAFPGHKSA